MRRASLTTVVASLAFLGACGPDTPAGPAATALHRGDGATVMAEGGGEGAEQSITFTSAPPDPAKVGYLYTASATGGGSGNPVTYRTDTPATCTIKGAVVAFISPGPCKVAANQEGAPGYRAAPQVTQAFDVFDRQWITFTSSAPTTAHPGERYVVTVTGGASGNPVVVSSLSPGVCSVLDGTVTFIAAGMCKIVATQEGNALFLPAGEVRQYIPVISSDPVFLLAANGITVTCKDAPVGSTGVVNGVVYTKRSRAELYALVAAANYSPLPTTCTTGITDMHGLFDRAATFNEPIGSWDVSAVTDMSEMFQMARAFNQPIGAWDVSAVTSTSRMFSNAVFFDQPIGGWNVAHVSNMSMMFFAARRFNQPIGNWIVSKVTNMGGMFGSADVFNQPIGAWDVAAVTNMSSMFIDAQFFNQPIGSWNVSRVTDMNNMFSGAYAFNQPIETWDVSSVTDMTSMFTWAFGFNQPLNAWDVSSVRTMHGMFFSAEAFNQPLDAWDVSSVTNMRNMFLGAELFNQPLSSWNVSSVTNMEGLFAFTRTFNQPLSSWNVSHVTNMTSMFSHALAFNQDLSHLCVSQLSSQPANYDASAPAWTLPRPVWGTCPP